MNIDERLLIIVEKMKKLSQLKPEFTCGEFPPKWQPPMSEKAVAVYEKQKGIVLPEDYRRFITTVASAGTQPFYGLYGLTAKKPSYEIHAIVEKPFPYTLETPLVISDLADEAYQQLFANDEESSDRQGYIVLCTEGCGMTSILIVNTEDKDTYGTVWFYDLCNDFGIAPIIDPKTEKPMHFLDWFEYYLDQTLTLPEDEFFSYIDLTNC